MSEITRQEQPNRWSCVHACIAMVLDIPVDEVVKHLGEEGKGLSAFETIKILREFNIHCALLSFSTLWHGWQIVAAPSLNMRGGNHAILVHWDRETGKRTVIDPSPLQRYKEDGSDLLSFSEITLVEIYSQ